MAFKVKKQNAFSVNLTPLLDVVFLLLIFFMLTSQFQKERDLPLALATTEGQTTSDPQNNEQVLSIDKSGQYFINGASRTIIPPSQLKARITEWAKQVPQPHLVIAAEGETPHQAVVTSIEYAQAAGFSHLNIRTHQDNHGTTTSE